MEIVDVSRLDAEVLVPSKWLRWLKLGHSFDFGIDETGKVYSMRVTQVDAVSQKVRVKGEFLAPTTGVLPGMSGVAKFATSDG